MELKGFIARVAQHEVDHLNGKLFSGLSFSGAEKEIKNSYPISEKASLKQITNSIFIPNLNLGLLNIYYFILHFLLSPINLHKLRIH